MSKKAQVKKSGSIWGNSPTPYLVDLMEGIDKGSIREVIVTKGCSLGMTRSVAKQAPHKNP